MNKYEKYTILIPIYGLMFDTDIRIGDVAFLGSECEYVITQERKKYLDIINQFESYVPVFGGGLSEAMSATILAEYDLKDIPLIVFEFEHTKKDLEQNIFSRQDDENLLDMLLHKGDRMLDLLRFHYCNYLMEQFIFRAGIIGEGYGCVFVYNNQKKVGRTIARQITTMQYTGLSADIQSNAQQNIESQDHTLDLIELTQADPDIFDEIQGRLAVALRSHYENMNLSSQEARYKSIITGIEFLCKKSLYERIEGYELRERIAKFIAPNAKDLQPIIDELNKLFRIRNQMTHNIKYFIDLNLEAKKYLQKAEGYFFRSFLNILTMRKNNIYIDYKSMIQSLDIS